MGTDLSALWRDLEESGPLHHDHLQLWLAMVLIERGRERSTRPYHTEMTREGYLKKISCKEVPFC